MTATENPIDNDDRLKGLLSKIKGIKTRKAYNTWRKAFLKIYTKYLDSNGILNGKDANYRLLKQLERLQNRIELIRPTFKEQTVDTANGRRLLTNLINEIVATERKVQELMPKTNADEERFGFDKFELAAVLLEDGFHGYDWMIQMRQQLESIIAHLVHENTNEIAIIHQYSDSVESFIKVMEDLKLFKIMDHCVSVVYQGKERPPPTPPPPPSDDNNNDNGYYYNDIDEAQELPEDSSICSDPDGDTLEEYEDARKPTRRKPKSTTTTSHNTPQDAANPTKTNKKKKKSVEKSFKSPTPTKTKKKAKKKGDSNHYGTDDTEEALEEDLVVPFCSSKPKKQSRSKQAQRHQQHQQQRSSRRRPPNENDDGNDSSSDDDDNDKSDQEDEDENENGVAEFLIYFDPKTNTIGRIPRQLAATQSRLVVDKSTEQYKNIVEPQDEKQELIFKLKKLERQKPQEENWLDAIKREKAAKAKATTAPQKKIYKSTARISRRNSNQGNSKQRTGYMSPLGVNKKPANVETTSSSFRNPLADGSSSSSSSSSSTKGKFVSKTRPKSYHEKYKQIADKPDSSGWSKPASSRDLLQ